MMLLKSVYPSTLLDKLTESSRDKLILGALIGFLVSWIFRLIPSLLHK